MDQEENDNTAHKTGLEACLDYWLDFVQPAHLATTRFYMAASNGMITKIPENIRNEIPLDYWLISGIQNDNRPIDFMCSFGQVDLLPRHVVQNLPLQKWLKPCGPAALSPLELIVTNNTLIKLLKPATWDGAGTKLVAFWNAIPHEYKTAEIRRAYEDTARQVFVKQAMRKKGRKGKRHEISL